MNMGKSDKIEAFITELLKSNEQDDWLELRRNELASIFECVPSQINYVIATRFNPQRGYAVESRRGGGGYLRIRRIKTDEDNPIYGVITCIGSSIDYQRAKDYVISLRNQNCINDDHVLMIASAISDNAIPLAQPHKDMVRAAILKNMLLSLV
jgi:transcriptional regulator CtsR